MFIITKAGLTKLQHQLRLLNCKRNTPGIANQCKTCFGNSCSKFPNSLQGLQLLSGLFISRRCFPSSRTRHARRMIQSR